MISKQQLIDSLNEVRQQALSGTLEYLDSGICLNWCKILNNSFSYDIVEQFSVGWAHRTTSSSFPVPDDGRFGRWVGINLEMRLSLIDHILKRLEASSQEDIDGWYYN